MNEQPVDQMESDLVNLRAEVEAAKNARLAAALIQIRDDTRPRNPGFSERLAHRALMGDPTALRDLLGPTVGVLEWLAGRGDGPLDHSYFYCPGCGGIGESVDIIQHEDDCRLYRELARLRAVMGEKP